MAATEIRWMVKAGFPKFLCKHYLLNPQRDHLPKAHHIVGRPAHKEHEHNDDRHLERADFRFSQER